MMATLVVPPPMSTTAEARGSFTRTPAPKAAASPSSIITTRPMRACSAALTSARSSTWVTPDKTLIIARRLKYDLPPRAFRTKCASICFVLSKSATTPSSKGAITVTSRASRPDICCASIPIAITSPVLESTATSEGSSITIPRPRTEMMVAADPISIAIESDTRFRRAFNPTNAAVLVMNDIKFDLGEQRKESLINFEVGQTADSNRSQQNCLYLYSGMQLENPGEGKI